MILIVAGVFLGVVFSHHGLLDLRSFEKQLAATKERIAVVEEENRKLRRQVDLLEESSPAVMERQAREIYGWARSGDKIFLEPSLR